MEFLKENHRIRFERLEAAPPIEEYVQTCVDVPRFLEYCKECGNYGNRWSCPPFREDPMEIWVRFQALRLIAYVLPSEPGAGRSEAGEGTDDGGDTGAGTHQPRITGPVRRDMYPVRRELHPPGGNAMPVPGANAVLY